jgi:hypothetical protein
MYAELETKLKGIETGHNLGAKLKLMKEKGLVVGFSDKKPEGNCDVVIDIMSEKMLMVQVLTLKACKVLGSSNWCIREQWAWDNYVGIYNIQYMIWDFTKSILDEKNLLGATLSPSNKVIHAQYDSKYQITGAEMEKYIASLDEAEKEYETES